MICASGPIGWIKPHLGRLAKTSQSHDTLPFMKAMRSKRAKTVGFVLRDQ